MSESSLPPFRFGPRRLHRTLRAVGGVFAGLKARLRRYRRPGTGAETTPRTPAGHQARAEALIRTYLRDNAATIERAQRFAERASRLDEEGTPSETARNRADRARREIFAGLAALRETFASSGGEEAGVVFDRSASTICPGFQPAEK